MATKFIDVDISAGREPVVVVQDTSTVTGHVRVAWDTTVSKNGLARALASIRLEVLNGNVFGDGVHTTDNRTAIDRTIA